MRERCKKEIKEREREKIASGREEKKGGRRGRAAERQRHAPVEALVDVGHGVVRVGRVEPVHRLPVGGPRARVLVRRDKVQQLVALVVPVAAGRVVVVLVVLVALGLVAHVVVYRVTRPERVGEGAGDELGVRGGGMGGMGYGCGGMGGEGVGMGGMGHGVWGVWGEVRVVRHELGE